MIAVEYLYSFSLLFLFVEDFFLYFWLCRVFVPACGLSLVAASGGHSVAVCGVLIVAASLVEQGLQDVGSAAVLQGLSCHMACGVFPDQGLNPCPLHWQADSLSLDHEGSPSVSFFSDTSLTA